MGTSMQWLKRTASDRWLRLRGSAAGKRATVVACVVLGGLVLTSGGALAMKAATTQIADAAVEKLVGGEDPQATLDAIAKRVVKQITSRNGVLGQASDSLTAKLSKAAGDKLAGIDADALLNNVSSEVVQAGMSKLDEISTDAIISEVTDTLIAQAMAKINSLDLEALAKSTLNGAVDDLLNSVDLEKLIKDEIAKIDVNAIVMQAVQKQFGSSGGSSSIWSMLFNR